MKDNILIRLLQGTCWVFGGWAQFGAFLHLYPSFPPCDGWELSTLIFLFPAANQNSRPGLFSLCNRLRQLHRLNQLPNPSLSSRFAMPLILLFVNGVNGRDSIHPIPDSSFLLMMADSNELPILEGHHQILHRGYSSGIQDLSSITMNPTPYQLHVHPIIISRLR